MEAFVWNERYITGEEQVDAEHQELVRIINWIIGHRKSAAEKQEMGQILDDLVNYAANHFAHETQLMVASGCDPRFLQAHVAVHQDFAEKVTKLRDTPVDQDDIEHLLRFLSGWLAHHILGMDQSMARQLRRIRDGISPAQAYEEELLLPHDPSTDSLLEAMGALYRLIASRNEALERLNTSLEEQVQFRTQELTASNEQLKVEQGLLHLAMQQLEITQRKLLESEHRRAATTRRNIEGMLAQIIDNDPVPTFVIDANHRITHWNKACENITGLKAADMIGTQKHQRIFYPPQERPIMADLILDGSLEERVAQFYQSNYRRSPIIDGAFESEAFFPHIGQGCWLFFTAAPLLNAEGERVGAIETLQDVTERRVAKDRLLAQQNQLEQMVSERTSQLARVNTELEADRKALEELLARVEEAQQQLLQSEKMAAIGQLAAGVAHEINNPVGFVNSNLGTLKTYIGQLFAVIDAYEAASAGGDPGQVAAARQKADLDFLREDLPSLLAESQEGLGRVTKIVQDLKDFSRVDQAEYQLADLNHALESTLNVVWNELKYKAEIVRELGEIPEVECIPAQINQVFMNLLVNAAQAIDTRGRITVRSGQENGHVWFEVADTGKGMSPEVCKRVFEPFFTTKPVGQGTGLGLSISYDIIVKKHHGRFDVSSTPGEGTTFRLWLPLRGDRD
ncbi:bacteriohemerythrin [Dechloromonas agitata]|uniref:bacteriohemerythrin n=1 Tax=Dechloromonas agitata TaxID=73030 RepID=UPI00237EA895|nr:bacteriohemerythrin [Dechloromonas agitata]MDE1545139.1 bacteriohemerythrin [Dechloromonas agitata]